MAEITAEKKSALMRLGRGLALVQAGQVMSSDEMNVVVSTRGDKTYSWAKGGDCPCPDVKQADSACKHELAAMGEKALKAMVRKLSENEQAEVDLARLKEASNILEARMHPKPARKHFRPEVAHIRAKGTGLIVLAGGEAVKDADFSFSGGAAAYRALREKLGTGYDVTLKASPNGPAHDLSEILGLNL
jgi:hypothetical protein